MSDSEVTEWRRTRRRDARAAIVSSAWALVRDQGLQALSLRELARRSGVTTPTVYAYFDSKNAIYDAMFGGAAEDFATWMAESAQSDDAARDLTRAAQRFADFCTTDIARYQLLFQHTIPDFAPSPESYAPAIRSLERTRDLLARCGVSDPRYLDLLTGLVTGLVDQQISNDPGGTRWTRLIDDAIQMFLGYCRDHEPDGADAVSAQPR